MNIKKLFSPLNNSFLVYVSELIGLGVRQSQQRSCITKSVFKISGTKCINLKVDAGIIL